MTVVGLIGPGRVGRSIAAALPPSRFSIGPILARTRSAARRAARELGRGFAASGFEEFGETRAVLAACPADSLGAIAEALAAARSDWKGVALLHVAALESDEPLAPFRRAGGAAASFHPLLSFAGFAADLADAWILSSGDPAAIVLARRMAKALKARARRVEPGAEARSRSAAAGVSAIIPELIDVSSRRLMEATGLPRRAVLEVVERLTADAFQAAARSGRARESSPTSAADLRALTAALDEARNAGVKRPPPSKTAG